MRLRLAATLAAAIVYLTTQAAATTGYWQKATGVTFMGDSIRYNGRTIKLGPKALFIDGSLDSCVTAIHPYAFNSFKKAAKHFTEGTAENPMCVYIAPWVYWVDNPHSPAIAVGKDGREPFGMTIRCNHLHLNGLATDARNVVLASQRGQTQGAVGNFTMFDFHGDGLEVSNLTMGNFCNVDLIYPLKPELGRPKRSEAITQAHVAYCHGDRAVARNVRFISRLNLNPMNGARRILYDRCHFECTDDALTGNGVYLNCTIDLYGQKPFYTTAPTGAVFLNSDFNVMTANRNMAFCKQPGALTLIDCRYHAPDSTYIGWTNYPKTWLKCYQAGFTLNGRQYHAGSRMPENTVCIDSVEAVNAFRTIVEGDTIYNTYNLLRGNDGWDPQNIRATLDSIGATGTEPMPTCLLADRRSLTMHTGDKPQLISAKAVLNGNYPMPAEADTATITWTVEPGYEQYATLTPAEHGHCYVTVNNDNDTTVTFSITASTASGLQAAVAISAVPQPLPAPAVTQKPQLTGSTCLKLSYGLNLRGRADRSLITWYRCRNSSGDSAIAVARGCATDSSLYTYRLTEADAGWHIMASIEPAHVRSLPGKAISVVTDQAVTTHQTKPVTTIETDFSTLPTEWQPQRLPGFWTVDGHKPADTAEYQWTYDSSKPMWTYGQGFNGATGTGLLQAQRGARLLYTPVDKSHGDMSVTLCVAPTKTAGQGFGSATGQYMDVYIKTDTRTMTGYALRIERTPKHAKAVDFSLVRYDHGHVTPITEPVSATCYRTKCTIKLDISGRKFTANIETTAPAQTSSILPNSVTLSAEIEPNTFGGTGVQHTGSCGESTTMLHSMIIEYR